MSITQHKEFGKWYCDKPAETYEEMASIIQNVIIADFSKSKRIETSISRATDGFWYGMIEVWYNDCLGCRGLEHAYRCPEHPTFVH